jgi:hypothetical protein
MTDPPIHKKGKAPSLEMDVTNIIKARDQRAIELSSLSSPNFRNEC